MNIKIVMLLTIFSLFSGCTQQQTYMGARIFDQKFILANGEEIVAQVTKSGPIPAQNDFFKIEVAGIFVGPSKIEQGKSAITWSFAFTSKKRNVLKKVEVELVYPGTEPIDFVVDEDPILNDRVWRGHSQSTVISIDTVPWLYKSGTAMFLFKFTIHADDGSVTKLYQPSFFTEQSKMMFRKIADI